jgi:hypothetical protein
MDVNEGETLLVTLDIDFKRLNIFDLKEKKRLSNWEYNIKGIEDSKSYTLCCSFDKKLILLGGEAGDLMQKAPLVTLHHFTEKMELIDMIVIKGSRDPIINLHADIHSGIIYGTDISENIFLIRIGDNFNLQLLRVLNKVQEGTLSSTQTMRSDSPSSTRRSTSPRSPRKSAASASTKTKTPSSSSAS